MPFLCGFICFLCGFNRFVERYSTLGKPARCAQLRPNQTPRGYYPHHKHRQSTGMPLILIGILLSFGETVSYGFVYAGIACFSLSLIFQLVTLPVEFNASRRAMETIQSSNILTEEEQKGARKTLTAAAMTYVAATAVALAQLLRLLMIFGGRRRND